MTTLLVLGFFGVGFFFFGGLSRMNDSLPKMNSYQFVSTQRFLIMLWMLIFGIGFLISVALYKDIFGDLPSENQRWYLILMLVQLFIFSGAFLFAHNRAKAQESRTAAHIPVNEQSNSPPPAENRVKKVWQNPLAIVAAVIAALGSCAGIGSFMIDVYRLFRP